ncbi:hypothetical protein [Candidatus Planktophila versatilis]|uniref:hypothetical protein n=1 Tax=Candidatus Planktophila versatilis TaxID=1884905 RepID=UPI000BACDA40|nr:hypothetical protein [Candidatus Planktophila versatilis]ASY25874.1 hypothetical protein A1sIIB142_00200 [Candidatus Planktophila versatilis]
MLSRPLPFNHYRFFKLRIHQLLLRGKINAPFLSGDSFASLANYYAYGKSGKNKIRRKKLKKAKIVFVAGHNLKKLMDSHFNDIHARVIICGNSDENFDSSIEFPPSVKFWLCQNNSRANTQDKVTIPIGLENLRLARAGFPKDFQSQNSNTIVDRVLMPPMWPTNPNRYHAVYQALKMPNVFDVYREYIPNSQYVEFFGRYKFVFCCEGNGYENHRVWESLYRNSFPVMLDTPWARTLIDLKIPILLVREISELNPGLLEEHLEIWKDFDPKKCESLWLPHWEKMVLEKIRSE